MQTHSFHSIRHQLHRQPELSGKERETARFIETSLRPFHPTKIIRSIGEHGLLAEYFFSEEGPTLLFRANMDAVAIDESKDNIPIVRFVPGYRTNAATTVTRPFYYDWPKCFPKNR